MKGAKRLTACAVAKCERKPAPMFCAEHLAMVSPEMRSRLGRAWWALRGRGTQGAPSSLIDLLVEAVGDISKALAKPEVEAS
jgi:hypothetical protein